MQQGENAELAAVRWLVDHGSHLLEGAEQRAVAKLEPWQVALIEQQRTLRRRAARRFPDAQKWLWTEKSLAQASDWWSADFKSRLFPADSQVLDGCCGAGADLVALARYTQVTGVDLSAALVDLARQNLLNHGLRGQVLEGDFLAVAKTRLDMPDDVWLHVDPDRRGGGKKTLDASQFQPSLEELLPLCHRAAGAVVKLAPNTALGADSLSLNTSRGWIDVTGECKQQLLLFGDAASRVYEECSKQPLSENPTRWAVLLSKGLADEGEARRNPIYYCGVDESDQIPLPCGSVVNQYVYELSPALHAAGLQLSWADEHQLRPITSSDGYYTSDKLIESPWVSRFQVCDIVAWDDRKLRRTMRKLDAGHVEVKCRLVRLDANQYQKRLSGAGANELTLLVTRLNERQKCLVCKRI